MDTAKGRDCAQSNARKGAPKVNKTGWPSVLGTKSNNTVELLRWIRDLNPGVNTEKWKVLEDDGFLGDSAAQSH
jgi:hypothetical protein